MNLVIVWLLRIFLGIPLWVLAFVVLLIVLIKPNSFPMGLTCFSILAVSGTLIEWICRRNTKSSSKENISQKQVESEKVDLPDLKDKINLLIRKYRGEIPFEALTEIMIIKDNFIILLPYLEQMNASDYELHNVTKIISDYLPKTLMIYSDLPRDFIGNNKTKDKPPEDILINQLNIMNLQIQSIVNNANNKKLDALLVQSEFLQSKFSENS